MVTAIFGESCVGKSTLAEAVKQATGAAVYSGNDILRFAKSEPEAREKFREMLKTAQGDVIYVVAEKEQLPLLPADCLRVLVTADIDTVKARFAKRTGGALPPALAKMLEKKHGMFDGEPRDIQIDGSVVNTEKACAEIVRRMRKKP